MIETFGMIVFNPKGKVLLVRHERGAGHMMGVYGLLVGRPENDETPVETAIREAREEAGINVSPDELLELPETYSADIPRADGTVKSFSMRLFVKNGYTEDIREGNEETTPRWISENELDTLKLLPNIKEAIADAKKLIAQ